ncbi:hypothetical protein IVB40_13610 [Bradyrhizobium sp. 40]|uniref:hypothetical protein n=1 Tax=Bradyrhizobium sp. 40 TaxID=2782674 RepID=UPI001FFED3F4|nr:hypothetical protein [Bradyrhizobium sp. 40]UPJ44979.1 hypothetical protein IVB40_13610 [Bradyrhizobium sp. 40]
MTFSASEFIELLVASDLTDDQVEQVVKMFRQAERALDKATPSSITLDFMVMRRKVILKDAWRKPWTPPALAPGVKAPDGATAPTRSGPTEAYLKSLEKYQEKWQRESEVALLKSAQKPKGPLN